MATETTVDTFTGVRGVVSYDGNPFAYVKFDAKITRDKVMVPRGGKYSDLALPGKVSFEGKLQYGLVTGDLYVDAMDDGTNTSSTSDETLHASIAGDGSLQTITSAISNPSEPMSLRVDIASSDGYSAGSITVMGTDPNDEEISETLPFVLEPTGSTTQTLWGNQRFKTVSAIIVPAVLSASDGVTVKAAGTRTVTIGDPKLVTITGKALRADGSYVQLTLTNCWLADLPATLGTASDAMLPESAFYVQDPDADITLTDVSPS